MGAFDRSLSQRDCAIFFFSWDVYEQKTATLDEVGKPIEAPLREAWAKLSESVESDRASGLPLSRVLEICREEPGIRIYSS